MNRSSKINTKGYFFNIMKYAKHLHAIESIFQNWGYMPTILPLIDREEFYTALMQSNKSNSFRTLDANRELMILRSDSTMFLSKILGAHLHADLLPLRLYYSNGVLQSSTEHDIEHWQSGAELIGVKSKAAEFEMLSLLYTVIDSIIDDFHLHIGSRTLLLALFEHNNPPVEKGTYPSLLAEIEKRSTGSLARKLNAVILECIFTIADASEYIPWKKKVSSIIGERHEALLDYTTYVEPLLELDKKKRVLCDISELGTHNYYTDSVYSVYSPNLSRPLAQGGRYDSLLTHYGYDAPAIGFTVFPHLIIDELISKNSSVENTSGNFFTTLYENRPPSKKELLSCYTALQKKHKN